MSVQVTARDEPFCKVILEFKYLSLLKTVEALAAPDFGVSQP